MERRIAEDLRDLERRAGEFVLDAEPHVVSLVRPARVCHRDAARAPGGEAEQLPQRECCDRGVDDERSGLVPGDEHDGRE